MRRTPLTLILGAALAVATPATQSLGSRLLGRAPLEDIVTIHSARFVTADIDDLLVVQDLGEVRIPSVATRRHQTARLHRLSLLRLFGDRFKAVWHSEPQLGSTATAWTSGDIDGDGRSELLLFSGDSCAVVSFDAESTWTAGFSLDDAWVVDAVVCDVNADGQPELITLDVTPSDLTHRSRLIRVYQASATGFAPLTGYVAAIDWGEGVEIRITGRARFQDYDGELPVFACTYPDPRPGYYAVLHQAAPDSFSLTSNPFPWQDWFSKELVLPCGELTFFNVGDTAAAYGYFVPGSRPTGPSLSFAALEDGEWRLLDIVETARHIGGPLCRFTVNGEPGWLELRDEMFRFYPRDIFSWREEDGPSNVFTPGDPR